MRIADRQVLKLIRLWLQTPVVEAPETKGGTPKVSRSKQGTPQGGVISPLLANLYLHWFDKVFYRPGGPAHWARAKLVRYADDFVVLAHESSPKLVGWIESKLETWMDLTINREKTRVLNLRAKGASLDFLGYTFRYDLDRFGHGHRYLNVVPSKKSLEREREKVRALTDRRWGWKPIPTLIGEVNRHLKSWASYFQYGYPSRAFEKINEYVEMRLRLHLRRRSQRPFRTPEGMRDGAHLQRLGWLQLRRAAAHPAKA
jgi:RNA-directed DNA polymerase